MTNPMLAELDELEPCPFCGREPAVRIPTDKDGFAVHVSCRCGAQLYGRNRHFAGEQEAIAAWNRRTHATLADMAKRLEALQYLAAAMYQAAGAYGMPVRFLDVLSAAGNGEAITEEQVDALLPCETPDTLQRMEAAERDGKRLDWLADRNNIVGQVLLPRASVEANLHDMRAAIDHAMNAAIDATQEGEG